MSLRTVALLAARPLALLGLSLFASVAVVGARELRDQAQVPVPREAVS